MYQSLNGVQLKLLNLSSVLVFISIHKPDDLTRFPTLHVKNVHKHNLQTRMNSSSLNRDEAEWMNEKLNDEG